VGEEGGLSALVLSRSAYTERLQDCYLPSDFPAIAICLAFQTVLHGILRSEKIIGDGIAIALQSESRQEGDRMSEVRPGNAAANAIDRRLTMSVGVAGGNRR
jgi:hypothetical protein